ncbi:hypothetical protein, partial [Campylobacter insulaenigrae]
MKKIEEFLDRLKGGESNFTRVPYEYDKYDCEMSYISRLICNRNLDSIIKFWNCQQEFDTFDIKHPIYNNVITRAVLSIDDYGYNYVFFIDDTNTYIWCLLQGCSIVDKIIVENVIYDITQDWRLINFNLISNIDIEDLLYKNINFAFVLSKTESMWHFFYDELYCLYQLDIKKPFKNSSCLFFPNKLKKTNKKFVFFKISLVYGSYIDNIDMFLHMGKNVYEESMFESKNCLVDNNKKYDLILWLSLVYRNGQGKTWLEQIDGGINILKELNKEFRNIKVYIDGIKSYDNNQIANNLLTNIADDYIYKIKKSIGNIDFVSLNRYNIRDAIQACSTVDLALCEAGSGAIIPVLCCRKPSCLYGNYIYMNEMVNFCSPHDFVRTIDFKYCDVLIDSSNNKWEGLFDYHISWQHVYNVIAELLEDLGK